MEKKANQYRQHEQTNGWWEGKSREIKRRAKLCDKGTCYGGGRGVRTV